MASWLISIVSCAAAAKSTGAQSALSNARLTGPADAALVMACTPTGVELCFNAIDDNCNGVIDEGCGIATGVLQFTIAWSESAADVDLSVTEPSGARVFESSRTSPSGMHLDRDCPRDPACNGQNIENVFFDGLEPPRGHYVVEVRLTDLHGAVPPIHVHLGARLGSKTYNVDMQLSQSDEKKAYSYDL